MKVFNAVVLGSFVALVGCQGEEAASAGTPEVATDDGGNAPSPQPGIHRDAQSLAMVTDEFTLQPGEEKYLCWTTRTKEAYQIAKFSKAPQPFVHHLLMTSTAVPEPEGLSECDGSFKMTWLPLFAAGAGAVDLAFPENVVNAVKSDTQILVQLHLLNNTDQPITAATKVDMELSEAPDPRNVVIGAFGNTDISLVPGQRGQVVADCQTGEATRVVGFFPHMHKLGRSMSFELGPDTGSLRKIYERAPFVFDDQRIDAVDMTMEGLSKVRVTCNYDNTTAESVGYGESTTNEMCWLITFLVGPPAGCALGSAPIFG